MSTNYRKVLALVVGAACATVLALPAAATPKVDGEHKVTICHATASQSNPYVEITIDVAAWEDPTDPRHHGVHHYRGENWVDFELTGGECSGDGGTGTGGGDGGGGGTVVDPPADL